MRFDGEVARIAALKREQPQNIAIQNFDPAYFATLDEAAQERFMACLASGISNPDSEMGCYACQPSDYDEFRPFFARVLAAHHKVALDAVQLNDWSLEAVEGLPVGGRLDLAQLGLPALSMRVRVGRNLADLPLPGSMARQQRIDLENRMIAVFDGLIADPDYGGAYHSLTPGKPQEISPARYQQLVSARLMFKDMSDDRYLFAAGIADDWPYGRGCYISADQSIIVWVGEEDHLRIMCVQRGTVLTAVFDRLKAALDRLSATDGLAFAHSDDYGVVTSCPTNLGTGMRASVHMALPKLTRDGSDARAKRIAKPLGLAVRGVGGEHTPIGADGTVDISPSARFCITEAEIIGALYKGLALLKRAEGEAAERSSKRARLA